MRLPEAGASSGIDEAFGKCTYYGSRQMMRHLHRLCVRFEGEDLEGLRDRRLGRVSPCRADAAELGRMCGLYRDSYADFSVKHFHEAPVREHR